MLASYLIDLLSWTQGAACSRGSSGPGVFLTLQPELLVEGIVFGNFDWVALGVEVIKLDVAALEPLAEVSGLLRRVRHVVRDELAPHGRDHHQVRVLPGYEICPIRYNSRTYRNGKGRGLVAQSVERPSKGPASSVQLY